MLKRFFFFHDYIKTLDEEQKLLHLGAKGSHLSEMLSLGIPAPPFFIINSTVCRYYLYEKNFPDHFEDKLREALKKLSLEAGKKFGARKKPLLVSVRSSGQQSMPGMMDTLLNVGLTTENMSEMVDKISFDFINSSYNLLSDAYKKRTWRNRCPDDAFEQLLGAIKAVFNSWENDRARRYREINNIDGKTGLSVIVQAMVFGNIGYKSGTGIVFSRNPVAGNRQITGEWLLRAQGEDLAGGHVTPLPINEETAISPKQLTLKRKFPEQYSQLEIIAGKLENHYRKMQEIEFTIEERKLWFLQTRNAEASPPATVKIARDMLEEGLIEQEEVEKVFQQLKGFILKKTVAKNPRSIAKGLPGSPGCVSGIIALTSENAEKFAEEGSKVILVRQETTPEDVHGIYVSEGVVTNVGGITSHAAVVARGWSKPCVTGCSSIEIDVKNASMKMGELTLKEKDLITIDGGKGEVYRGALRLSKVKVV